MEKGKKKRICLLLLLFFIITMDVNRVQNNITKFLFFGIECNSGVFKTCHQVHNSIWNRFGKNFHLIQTKLC